MEPVLFSTIEEILPVLDRGVTIDFRHMINLAGLDVVYRGRIRYRIYVRSWIFENMDYKPRPTTELEEQKICIVHEFIHALNYLRGVRMPRSREAKNKAEEIIDKHAYTFLDNDVFF